MCLQGSVLEELADTRGVWRWCNDSTRVWWRWILPEDWQLSCLHTNSHSYRHVNPCPKPHMHHRYTHTHCLKERVSSLTFAYCYLGRALAIFCVDNPVICPASPQQHCWRKSLTTNRCGCVPIKLYLLKQADQIWPSHYGLLVAGPDTLQIWWDDDKGLLFGDHQTERIHQAHREVVVFGEQANSGAFTNVLHYCGIKYDKVWAALIKPQSTVGLGSFVSLTNNHWGVNGLSMVQDLLCAEDRTSSFLVLWSFFFFFHTTEWLWSLLLLGRCSCEWEGERRGHAFSHERHFL
jgi:hypothetical protein